VSLSIGGFVRIQADARRESIGHLTEFGAGLLGYVDHLTADAVGRVQGTKGLFESSEEVTAVEFEHFVSAISSARADGAQRGGMAYAARVPAADLKQMVAEAKSQFPWFSVHDLEVSPITAQTGRVYWPILYTSAMGAAGFDRGFDLGSHPAINFAIDASLDAGGPAASPFLRVRGDDMLGDLVIVNVIRRRNLPVGLAVATLQLDELLVDYAQELLGPNVKLQLRQDTEVDGLVDVPIEDRWVGHATVAGQPFTIFVDNHQLVTGTSRGSWVLGLGFTASMLLGWMMSGRTRRNAMRRRLKALETAIAEKDNFLASVSHAIRTPMTSIVGALELLNDQRLPLEEGTRTDLLRDARISALDLEHLTENYLTGARVASGAFTVKSTVVDLDLLTSRVLDSLDIPKRIVVTVEQLGRCQGDVLRIHQIIRNVLRNASQHASSSIVVRVRLSHPFVVLQISNDGRPVPNDAVDKMFGSLEKGMVRGQPDSISLGLSVSRGLARIMGGDLTYRYENGKVSFEVALRPEIPFADSSGPKHSLSAA
jgi:signal transduction histidine kinase